MAQHDPVWSLDAGDVLVARSTFHMESGACERVFTAGHEYVVLRVLPLRTPAVAVVIDDAGEENKIDADFLANFDRKRN